MKKVINFLLALSLLGVFTCCSDSGNSIIDDPLVPRYAADLCFPFCWSLASVPADPTMFPEASLKNDVASGKNRALLSWYNIDSRLIHHNSTYAPDYIKNDLDALSYPYSRAVTYAEIFPELGLKQLQSTAIKTLNLSFYPRERGPYNLDATNIDQDGYLLDPERRWGGIMCSLSIPTLITIDSIHFWMMDPFMDPELGNQDGGYLYFNLGDVSEDILKDGLKSWENGLPIDGDTTYIIKTVWGKVSVSPQRTYAFDNSQGPRIVQDVGFDGLINAEEYTYPTYKAYLEKLCNVLPASTIAAMSQDPFSPFNDPAGDNYAFYRSNYYDSKRSSIIERYKHYNGTEGNSLSRSDAADPQHERAHSTPDAEDINLDNTLNENERYFQYRVCIHPDSMQVGRNYITDKREAKVHTPNGEIQLATWYQFTIPLHQYQKKVGSIQDFSDIRSIRIFMTGFRETTHLRFATLELK